MLLELQSMIAFQLFYLIPNLIPTKYQIYIIYSKNIDGKD